MRHLKIEKTESIRFHIGTKPKSPFNVLELLFIELNSCGRSPLSTYYAKCNEDNRDSLQCVGGKRRSLTDIYSLVKYYFPYLSRKKFFKTLLHFCESYNMRVHYCTDVNKVVFTYLYFRRDESTLRGSYSVRMVDRLPNTYFDKPMEHKGSDGISKSDIIKQFNLVS